MQFYSLEYPLLFAPVYSVFEIKNLGIDFNILINTAKGNNQGNV